MISLRRYEHIYHTCRFKYSDNKFDINGDMTTDLFFVLKSGNKLKINDDICTKIKYNNTQYVLESISSYQSLDKMFYGLITQDVVNIICQYYGENICSVNLNKYWIVNTICEYYSIDVYINNNIVNSNIDYYVNDLYVDWDHPDCKSKLTGIELFIKPIFEKNNFGITCPYEINFRNRIASYVKLDKCKLEYLDSNSLPQFDIIEVMTGC
jgi:hypothetical protein